ncbi:MAG: phosphonopyruvate decarboxylase [Gammaproteobacteria bacterium]|nr:MAG: phosphonopyruvate decarboxylase [Gammaproteobacteria bacterium]
MIEAARFVGCARALGFDLYTGVPCSYLKPFINYVIDADGLDYIGVANEGDAVAIAAGAELGGRRGVVMLQNSGLGNTVNPLTSLTHTFNIPVLVIVTLRGEPGGAPDEPQHELMGQITARLLELMEIPWAWFPTEDADIEPALARADEHLTAHGRPYALIMRKGSVAQNPLQARPDARAPGASAVPCPAPAASRRDMLGAVQAATGLRDIVVATTGYTGRELCALDDRPNQIYMAGSMGCVASLGLGLALAQPDRRIIVLDGDGAALMRLGALATIGSERPARLVHVLLDNGIHESTGGQTTVSVSIDFTGIAAACGYPQIAAAGTPDELATLLRGAPDKLTFIYVPIVPGVPDNLPRPTCSPSEVAARLRAHLAAGA